ncbi:thiamine pyrophosphate-binding protein [Salinirubellus salinus]|uniref:Thiamine pyrophosphate-binding protein n=1 Tax=Salinirubellus salinus TaxID=1364945 RepID=A0A9E7U3F8_9EURY|nr:thiamine pyrophosphate-binding protein [Salinirubellus salinus]UWM53205.1 thiamine pyrophosphate-binding protein [Salinirubellus salinus]
MTDSDTGADVFVDALERYGVQHVFGNPGTTELPVMHALEDSDVEYVLGLHEDVAVGAAAGYASTRRYHAHDDPSVNPVGVANLHVAPGLAHGLGNLYGAMVAGAPLVVTAGNHSRDFRHEEPILSGDLVEMAAPFTKWSDEVLDVRALPTMLRRAFRVALTPPTGPVFLALPLDVMQAPAERGPERLGPIPKPGRAAPEQVVHAADYIADADDLAIVVGDHVARAGLDAIEAAVDLAEASGARVHGEILSAEMSFPGDHDQWVSFVPSSEGPARETLDADTLVFVGCSTNTTLTRRERPLLDPETTCVHVGVDPWQLGKNEPVDAVVYGDLAANLGELADLVADRVPDSRRERRLDRTHERRAAARVETATGSADDRPTKGELADALRAAAPDAFLVDEGVTSKYALLRRWPLSPRQFLSNKGGGLGYGLPASVGAALAASMREDPRSVVGFVGDGSYLYYPHAVYTAARYDLDLTVVVSDNRNYRILKDNMLALEGGEESDYAFLGTDFDPPVDVAGSARAHGASAELVERNADLAPALDRALATDGPSVVDVLVSD